MSRVLTQREKVLSYFVGGVVLLIVNLFVINYFTTNHARLRAERLKKTAQLQTMKKLLADAPLWQQREARLTVAQPRMENEATATVQLWGQIQEAGKRDSVTTELPQLGGVVSQPSYTEVTVEFETKSTWGSLVDFLGHLQDPEQFVVVESSNLRVDSAEPTMMRGHFRIAKWFAPKLAGNSR